MVSVVAYSEKRCAHYRYDILKERKTLARMLPGEGWPQRYGMLRRRYATEGVHQSQGDLYNDFYIHMILV